ncbi:GntR family transcriptional regulator [Streptosporangium saharense]|uniref:DNA-binding GntR family transcriptional regulator n=1 Tax=Streptosporangium saharense TaxID=1706840 RepID=A0A7W7VK54_9ACTN|nr:winged helix-turn-helix domain-containing protein [Streptosporangium saharense]MBB4913347.1 DNA-binding GntR family transcriptional regulator [Streptosporangium saharense]
MAIDDNDPRPPFLQLADALRQDIKSGQYPPGTRLPSIRELAKTHGISAQTVQNALRELRHEGLVISQQGRALFVRDPERGVSAEPSLSERVAELESTLKTLANRVEALEAAHQNQ